MKSTVFFLALAMALMLLAAGAANNTRILHKFAGPEGANPVAGLIFDNAGNLYGTASSGTELSGGSVFKLTPNSNGSWTYSVLYSFTGGLDGHVPVGGLIFDKAGNLYGTAS